MTRDQIAGLFRGLYGSFTHVTVENKELIPAEGPFILATNHMSRLDFPVMVFLPRQEEIYALAGSTYKTFPVFGKMISDAGMIWIDRSKADFSAMKAAMNVLKEGKILTLAPEGTRSRTGQLIEAKEGIVLLASKSRVPLMTVSVTGTEDFMGDFKHFRKPNIRLRLSPLFNLPEIDRNNREESLRKATDEVMCHIAAMLPASYRGYYREYPRVRELQEEWRQRGDIIVPED